MYFCTVLFYFSLLEAKSIYQIELWIVTLERYPFNSISRIQKYIENMRIFFYTLGLINKHYVKISISRVIP